MYLIRHLFIYLFIYLFILFLFITIYSIQIMQSGSLILRRPRSIAEEGKCSGRDRPRTSKNQASGQEGAHGSCIVRSFRAIFVLH